MTTKITEQNISSIEAITKLTMFSKRQFYLANLCKADPINFKYLIIQAKIAKKLFRIFETKLKKFVCHCFSFQRKYFAL